MSPPMSGQDYYPMLQWRVVISKTIDVSTLYVYALSSPAYIGLASVWSGSPSGMCMFCTSVSELFKTCASDCA